MRTARCTVVSMNYSACGLRVGDYFEAGPDGVSLPPGRHFCFYAIAAAATLLTARLNAPDATDWLRTRPLVACPDPPENLLMRIEEAPSRARSHSPGRPR